MTKALIAGLVLIFGIQSQAQSITAAAQQAQSALQQSATMNTMMGGLLLTQCMPGGLSGLTGGSSSSSKSQQPNLLLCMMGAMALMQGIQASHQANQAQQAIANSASVGTFIPVPVPVPATPVAAQPGLNYLAGSGYSVTPNGIITPTGTILQSSTFSSPSAMAKLGFSPSVIQTAQQTQAAAHFVAAKQAAKLAATRKIAGE